MDARRKKLLYQSQHCGMKENDVLLGQFAAVHMAELSEDELDLFEGLLLESDLDLYSWIIGREPVPERVDNSLMAAIITYNASKA